VVPGLSYVQHGIYINGKPEINGLFKYLSLLLLLEDMQAFFIYYGIISKLIVKSVEEYCRISWE